MKRMKLFLDTNVLIDYYAQRSPFFEDVAKIQIAQIMGDVELWVAPHSLPDASYILRKAVPAPRLQEIMENSLEFLTVSSGAQRETLLALSQRWDDFEDSFVHQCACRAGADYIISRDEKGFARSSIPVLSPTAFLEFMEAEHGIVYEVFASHVLPTAR